MNPLVTVIGIGNPYRHDDGAAAAVLHGLAGRWRDEPRVRLVELDGESTRLVDAWEGSPVAWVVDAVRSGRPPGTVHEFDARHLDDIETSGARSGASFGGGHLLGLGEAVSLARVLDRLPRDLRVMGVEGEDFTSGEGLGDAVRRGVADAVDRLDRAIAEVLASADAGEQFADR